jgi:dihydroceramidase
MFTPSSVNWCENDYTHSEIIAEYWNTITGIFIIISALYNFYQNKRKSVWELYFSNFLLLLVGVGTMLFHGTLFYIYQLLDEVPMILLIIEYYKLVDKDTVYLPKLYSSIPVIVGSYYVHPDYQVILFQSFIVTGVVLLAFHFSYFTKKYNIDLQELPIILTITIFSTIIWSIDKHYCNYVVHLNLHAIWHITTAIGMIFTNKFMTVVVARNRFEQCLKQL